MCVCYITGNGQGSTPSSLAPVTSLNPGEEWMGLSPIIWHATAFVRESWTRFVDAFVERASKRAHEHPCMQGLWQESSDAPTLREKWEYERERGQEMKRDANRGPTVVNH